MRENALVAFVACACCREPTRSVMVERAVFAFLAHALDVELAKFARLSNDCSFRAGRPSAVALALLASFA